MHIVGVPIIENCTRGMKKQVGKSQLFTKESLTKIQDKMITACIKFFNKFYDRDIKLKEKQKGRNQDINVKDMSNYTNIKKQLAEKEKKLDKANKQTNRLDNTTKDINQILDNLKPAKFNKNNMVISNEDVEKIKNFTFDRDKQYKYVSDDLYKNGIFTDDKNEIANNIDRKIKPKDEINKEKNNRKKYYTRF